MTLNFLLQSTSILKSTLQIILLLTAHLHAVCNTKYLETFYFHYVHKCCDIEMRYKREMLGFLNIYLDLELFENIAMD